MSKPNNTVSELSFANYKETRHCSSYTYLNYSERCEYIKNSPGCKDYVQFINYIEILHCDIGIKNNLEEAICTVFLACISLFYLFGVFIIVDSRFVPVLKIIARKLYLGEHLAGVTLITFGHNSPDLLVHLSKVNKHVPAISNACCSSLCLFLLSGGLTCYLSPFDMCRHAIIRDLLFLLLGLLLMDCMYHDGMFTILESISLLLLYLIYLCVICVDLFLAKRAIRTYQAELEILVKNKKADKKHIEHLENELIKLLQETKVDVQHLELKITKRISFATRSIHLKHNITDENTTKFAVYNPTHSTNINLFFDFFETIGPIDLVNWKTSGWIMKIVYILKVPIQFICIMVIPCVDYQLNKHGWSKLLNCIQIMLTPFVVICVILKFMETKAYAGFKFVKFNLIWPLYSLSITAPIAIMAFVYSRTDVPPKFHIAFAVGAALVSIFSILLLANEFCGILELVGIVLNLSESFMFATIGAVAVNFGELVTNFYLVLYGSEEMAFAATIGSGLFRIFFQVGMYYTAQRIVFQRDMLLIECDYTLSGLLFLEIAVFGQILWTTILNFTSRRSMGIYSFIVYLFFLLHCALIELNIIHPMSDQRVSYV